MTHAVIVTGGELGVVKFPDIAPWQLVIAADSGLHGARSLGLSVDLAVGDFDSVDSAVLEIAEQEGVRIERHSVAKNATDLEIAVERALEWGATQLTVVGGVGGRLDQLLAIPLLLARERYASMAITMHSGPATVSVIHDEAELHGQPSEYVSLLPVEGEARDISTTGLLYELNEGVLHAGTTRGVSNEFVSERATVRVGQGTLLAVQPGHR